MTSIQQGAPIPVVAFCLSCSFDCDPLLIKRNTLSLLLFLLASVGNGGPLLAGAGFPGNDYNLEDLIGPSSEAVFDAKSQTIQTTGSQSQLFLQGLAASPTRQVRTIEVELLAPATEIELYIGWTEAGSPLESLRITVPPNTGDIVVLNISSMGNSQGPVRVHLDSSSVGAVISRVTLVERDQPNLILLMVDDLSAVEMTWGFGRALPVPSFLVDELIDKGVTFDQFFNTTALCCPARTSYLTGQYSHNHGIWGNNYTDTGGNGGWRRFWELGHENNSLGIWMQAAGYETALIGKFLNQYPNLPGQFVPETYVPLGWDQWFSTFNNETFEPTPLDGFSYTSFRMNENGTVVEYVPPSYLTDVESSHAINFLQSGAGLNKPFFLYLAPFAPHGPIQPPPRHEGAHAAIGQVPIPPSFNEPDLSDKPIHIQVGAVSFNHYFGASHLRKLDMTLAVDEMIDSLFQTLEAEGLLDSTYVFFVSDNGLMAGEHGIGGKSAPYEESIRVPMIIRGPGISAATSRQELVLNIDMAPTLLDLAGADLPPEIDGESFVELLTGVRAGSEWRDVVQVELLTEIHSPNQNHIIPPYAGVRSPRFVQVEYETMEQELYNLDADPFQLESFHLDVSVELHGQLQAAMTDLSSCSGSSCRLATRRGWPTASFSVNCALRSCSFDGSGSSAQGTSSIAAFVWDFGDGQSSSGQQVDHDYDRDGIYTANLTVVDTLGITGTDRQELTASDPLFVDGFESGDLLLWSTASP